MPSVPIFHPAIDIDLRYATSDNITHRRIYDRPVALLRPEAQRALVVAADLASAQGLRLRVFDAYRPVAAQWRLWKALPDPTFVADPRIGSLHCRGVAVDLTLASADGVALDMGTGFDDMTPRSGHARIDIPVATQRHRALLLGLMTASGWAHLESEWWHYHLPDWERHPPLDDDREGRLLMDLPPAD
jgi:D-alanyl-D-alanine dipeptidase